MPYKFHPGKMYRMPTHFGPSLGRCSSSLGVLVGRMCFGKPSPCSSMQRTAKIGSLGDKERDRRH